LFDNPDSVVCFHFVAIAVRLGGCREVIAYVASIGSSSPLKNLEIEALLSLEGPWLC